MNNQFGIVILSLAIPLVLIFIIGICSILIAYGVELNDPNTILIMIPVLMVIWLL